MYYPRGDHYCAFVLTGPAVHTIGPQSFVFRSHGSDHLPPSAYFYCLWSWRCSEGLSLCFTALLKAARVQHHTKRPIHTRLSAAALCMCLDQGWHNTPLVCAATRRRRRRRRWPALCKAIRGAAEARLDCRRAFPFFGEQRFFFRILTLLTHKTPLQTTELSCGGPCKL